MRCVRMCASECVCAQGACLLIHFQIDKHKRFASPIAHYRAGGPGSSDDVVVVVHVDRQSYDDDDDVFCAAAASGE